MDLVIQGAKAGQAQASKPSIADDTIASISRLKILYGLSEGEVKGLANGAASIKLEGTPLVDENGKANFEGVEWEIRTGTVDQTHIAGMPSASNEIGVGTTLLSGTPWIRSITNKQLSSINVNVSFPMLKKVTDKGDVVGVTVAYAIDVQTDGGGYVTMLDTSLTAKTSGRYQKTHNIKLPEAQTNWQIRVRKITADGNNETLFNTMQIDSIAEIIDAKLRYPNTALLYLSFDAKTFSNIPKVSVDMLGVYVQVPSNYDTVTRTSTGLWNGTFKQGYTDNPAWIYYNLVTNDRYGLGDKLQPFMVNKWALEHIARVCDEPVSDGQGGFEPRFTCNLYLQKSEDAYQVLQHIAGIFRGMSFWNGSQIIVDADTARDAEYVITRANVINGAFVKTGSAASDRHTIAQVAYSNPANGYETEYAMVRNEQAIAQLGINILDLSAVGCTSEGQAYRMGLAALLAETNRTQTVSFAMGLDGSLPAVGSRIDIADMMFTGANNGGRISSVSANRTVITVDRDNVPATIGDKLIVNLESGKAQERVITAISGRAITVALAFDAVASENVWAVNTAEMPTMPFIVMSATQNDDGTQYNFTAMQYDPTMYAQIDSGTIIEQRPPAPQFNPYIIDAPDSVTLASRHRVSQGVTITTLVITWAQVKDAIAYDVEWRKDDGDWIKLPRTGNISAEIDGVYSGNYLARVRSVSAFDAISKATSSMLTAVTGKVGLPPTIVGLVATGVLFGMELKWGFGAGSGDSDYTEIQVGSAPNVNVAALTQASYPTNTHTINGLQGGLAQSYRARLIDKLGNKSAWSAWVTATTDNSADKVLDLIDGQIKESSLNTILTTKIADIKINKEAIGSETTNRVEALRLANLAIGKEATDRVEALRLASLRTDGLQGFADDLAFDISTVTRAEKLTSEGLAVVKERADAFEIENGLQAQKLDYISSELSFGYTDASKRTDKARGTVWTFAKTVAHADYVNSQLITGLSADYQNSSARFTENINLLTTKNEAVATKTTNLSAQMVGGYEGSDLTKLNSGLLFEESKVRASDIEGLAEQISLLSAGVGEQFDSFEIWHFNTDADGWSGGTYNSDGWINVRAETIISPTVVDLDGGVYKHVKLRIKKVGTPTWQGLLSYAGGSQTIAEPSYDESNIALVNWHMEWSGDITSFSLKVASAGDNLNYYSIDWIAVGRPSPGASNASLLRESKVRASETSANASDLVALNSQINGGGSVPIESSITKKLETTATLASTTAEDLTKLTSTYDDDMYGYEGTVQTTARTLASATQAAAEKLELLSANVLPTYTDATKYTDSSRSVQWTYAKTVAADNYAANERITNLQSNFANSNANFTNELFTLTEKDKSIAANITQLYAETSGNFGLIQKLDLAISTPTSGLAAQVTELQSSTSANTGAANAAQSTANQAVTDANNKSEQAKSDAIEAARLFTVAEAKAKADAAQANASTDATTKANAAKSAAELAAAADAKAKADKALSDAKLDATAKADAAKKAAIEVADAAQLSANNAATAASNAATAAGNKGEVIYGSITPTVALQKAQNLWIDTTGGNNTPKRWSGAAWLSVTDKAATDAQAAANAAQGDATKALGDAKAANDAVVIAKGVADAAKLTADAATGKLTDISADNKLTAVEKQQTKVIVNDIKLTNASVLDQALKYGVSSAAYATTYNALVAYIDPKLVDMSATSTIVRTAFDSKFNDLFAARASLYTAINAAAKAVADAARTEADKANDKLLPANLGSFVEQSGAFSDEFGSISGKLTTMQGVVDGQKTAIEVTSAVGNAEKLKNEIAKARLDKDVTNLNAQSVALTNSINSYTAKVTELTNKRDAPKPPDMEQQTYLNLQAEYDKQIAEINAAKADLIAQKAVIADQVAQIAAEKKVIDDLKIIEDNVKAQHTIKIDAADGSVVGYGLVLDKQNVSNFNIRANNINFLPPSGGDDGTSQFVVRNTASVIDGVSVPAGVYARNFYAPKGSIDTIQIKDAAIKSAQIDNLAVTTGKIANLAVDTLQIAGNAVTIPRIKYVAGTVAHNQSGVKARTLVTSATMDVAGGVIIFTVSIDEMTASVVTSSIPEKLVTLYRGTELLKTWVYKKMQNGANAGDSYNISTTPFAYEPPLGSHEYSIYLEGMDNQTLTLKVTGTTLFMQGAKR